MKNANIGLFPFGGRGNPYTTMIKECIMDTGAMPVPLFDTKFFPLRRACRANIDLLQLYWPGNLYKSSTRLGCMVKRMMFEDGLRCMRKISAVYSVENLIPHDAESDDFEFKMTQKIIDSCKGFIVMSKTSGEIFRNHFVLPQKSKTYVVPHRNYIGVYPDSVSRADARNKLGIASGKKVILSLGRINPYKGLDRLIPAFLSIKDPDALLLIAGSAKSPEILDQLNGLIQAHTRPGCGEVKVIPKFVPDDEIQVYHRASDIVALSYSDVPMNPGSLILSMGFGVAIVAPLKGAIQETVGDDALFGYDENISDALSRTLQNAISDKRLVERGAAARERVLVRHSREVVANAFKRMYEDFGF